MCIVGLGWGRATRTTTLTDVAAEAVSGPSGGGDAVSVDAIADGDGADTPEPSDVPSIGEEDSAEVTAADLFDPAATGRVVMLWILTPTVAAVASFLVFRFLPI